MRYEVEKNQINMAEIDVISTCSIQQASPNFNGISKLHLTAWDIQLLFLDPIQKGILFHKPEYDTSFTILRLKTSLARALDFFPPLAGRLVKTKNDGDTVNYFVDCNNSGASFTHAIVHGGMRIDDILGPVNIPSIIGSFFPLNNLINSEGVSNPLLAVKVTELEDGFFIACTMNHAIADGSSFWHFFNSWAEITRGPENTISRIPDFERSAMTLDENGLILIQDQNPCLDFSPPQLLERFFHFSKENISKLKSRANSEAETDKISSLQALIALLWRVITRCRSLTDEEEVGCRILVGARNRLPLITESYFGNAIISSRVATKSKDLLHNGFGWVAMEVNKTVALQTSEEVRRVTEDLVKNPKVLTKNGSLLLRKNIFLVSSSPRHNVYGSDFGWGKPVTVRGGPGQKCDGKVTVFPAPEGGGIDVEICLAPEILIALADDSEFKGAFC